MLVYLADTGWALLTRARPGGHPRATEAHRDHVYQRVLRRRLGATWPAGLATAGASVACACIAAVLLPCTLARPARAVALRWAAVYL